MWCVYVEEEKRKEKRKARRYIEARRVRDIARRETAPASRGVPLPVEESPLASPTGLDCVRTGPDLPQELYLCSDTLRRTRPGGSRSALND